MPSESEASTTNPLVLSAKLPGMGAATAAKSRPSISQVMTGVGVPLCSAISAGFPPVNSKLLSACDLVTSSFEASTLDTKLEA